LIQKVSKGLCLDAGCGKGPHAQFYNGTVIFADINYYFVSSALARYCGTAKAYGVVSDIRYLPFPDSLFDFIVCSSVIEHLYEEDVLSTLDSLKLLTRGRLQIDVPNEDGIISDLRKLLTRLGVYATGSSEDLALEHHSQFSPERLKGYGFEVRGCIGWVSSSRIKIGPIWDLYDSVAWRMPYVAGTLIGLYEKKQVKP